MLRTLGAMVRTLGALVHRRWPVVVVSALACLMVGALWAAAQTPRYRSSVTVGRVPAPIADAGIAVPDLRSLLTSPSVTDHVAAAAGLSLDALDISLREAGSSFTIAVAAADAAAAKQAAQAYGDALTSMTARIGVDAAVAFEIRSQAHVAAEPFSPNLRATALATGLVGILLGSTAAVMLERFRPRSPTSGVTTTATQPPTPSIFATDVDTPVDPALAWFLELSRAAAFDDDGAAPPTPDMPVAETIDDEPVTEEVDLGRFVEPVRLVTGVESASGLPTADVPPAAAIALSYMSKMGLPVADLPPQEPRHVTAGDASTTRRTVAPSPTAFSALIAGTADTEQDPERAPIESPPIEATEPKPPTSVPAPTPTFSSLVADATARQKPRFSFVALALAGPDDDGPCSGRAG